MTKNIHLITPVFSEGIRSLEDVKPLEKYGIKITHHLLDAGPASIECEVDEALAVPDTIKKCIEAERSGADAIVIDCMGDPGLKPAREAVSIPVLGPLQTSVHLAAMLGQKFSIVTVLDTVVPMLNNLTRAYGLDSKLASVRVIDLPVLEIEKNIDKAKIQLSAESLAAIKEDKASVIIFGCTGFLGCADAIIDALAHESLNAPVIDPVPVTILQAAAIANAGLSQSKITYAFPRKKEVRGYKLNLGYPEIAAE